MEFIFSQILGFIALFFVCIGYFAQRKSFFLIFQIISNVFYGFSFLLANSIVGFSIILVSTLRCIFLFIVERHPIKYTLLYLLIFVICYILLGILFYKTILDIIPIICAILFTFSFYIKNLQIMRYCVILPNLLFIFYNIACTTYSNALLDSIEVIAIIVAIIKFHKTIYASPIN